MAAIIQQTSPLLAGQDFRDAMSMLAAPVAVVTVRDEEGRPWGFTASSVVSLSLDPPRALVGIARSSSCYRAMIAAPEFVVNLLGDQHRDVARRFSARGGDRFAGGEFTSWPGASAPYLPTANASLRCVTTRVIPAGDHDLLVAGLLEVRAASVGKPLLYYRRGFCTAT